MDHTMMLFWGIVLAVTIIAEAVTVQMISIWFALASLVSLFLAALNAPIWAQFAVFVAVAAILLIFTRDIAKRIFRTSKTNVDLSIGETALVTEDINNDLSTGRATIAGVSWMARSADGSLIPKDSIVIVEAIDGAKLIVKTK